MPSPPTPLSAEGSLQALEQRLLARNRTWSELDESLPMPIPPRLGRKFEQR
jgi:hypothetical protein